ncbi:MarR family winged helix-turn-helix transcriptional regulator [Kribbella speibonae]|uniref:MarR family transcriptional regulator n=1 Tax=Kribbella speibonae TaxID=1572660 RepID=A0A4V6N433_9ACTN|nr:MarR family transcriptional regulator [Kribbella speibonae]TCC25253.1 MarR family transcriptional regulator [Kribbella speibonae]TCC33072.1 MarR family transcriptional regulator [Kribbella speibonae]
MGETGRPPLSPALLLVMLGGGLRTRLERDLRAEGLSLRHFSALGHLAHQPGLSYSELARRDGITTQSMQSTLLQLQDMGAVERLTAPGRGRAADLKVTAAGEQLLGRCRVVLSAIDAELAAQLGAEAADGLAGQVLQLLAALADDPSEVTRKSS